jgi:hypothetical protein
MIPGIGALVALLLLFACPAFGPVGIVLAVNLYLWGRRAAIVREQRARQAVARARAEARREQEVIQAWLSL